MKQLNDRPPQSLKEELKSLKLWFDSPHYKAPLELDDDAIDLILKAIENRLPEKKQGPSRHAKVNEPLSDFHDRLGYNQAIEDIKQLLSEK